MLGQSDGLSDALDSLKAIGVRLVLDDFGTGYSSLAYLTRLPLDALKVDRSFVDGLGIEARDTAITEAIIAMSHALSLEVVGEGAETELQIAELRRLGCDLAQGFHVSRPMAADAFTNWLKESEPDLSSWARTGAVLLDPPAAGAANGDGAAKDEAPEKRSRTASIGAR